MKGLKARLEGMVRLFLFSVAACFTAGSALQPAQAQVYITAQAIIICQTPANGAPTVTTTPGTGCSPHNSLTNPTGTVGSSTNPYGWFDAPSATDINSAIAKQAGVILSWVSQPLYYNNSNFQSITDLTCNTRQQNGSLVANPSCTAPYVLNSAQFTMLTTAGSLSPSPLYPNDNRVLNVFFGGPITPPANLPGKLAELAWIGRNGVYVTASAFSTGRTTSPCFGCIVHGMMHNQGLDHQDVFNYNTQSPSQDLMTPGSTRKEATDSTANTVAAGTSNAVSLIGTGNGNGQAYQLTSSTTPTTPTNPGTSFQKNQIASSGLVTSQALMVSTITDPPGSDLINVSTTNAGYIPSGFGSIPSGWPNNPTLIRHTLMIGQGLAFDPLNTVKFTKNGSYVQSFSYHTGNANDPDCPPAKTCLVMAVSNLPSSAGPLQFSQGIKVTSPPPPPGSTLLANVVARGLYFTYKTNDGLSVTSKMTSTLMTSSQDSSTPATPSLVDPVVQKSFTSTVTTPPDPCNKNVDSSIPKESNGCPIRELRDGDPRVDTAQWTVPAISSCTTASSLSVLAQIPNVTAYVANGSWTDGHLGIRVVPIAPTPLAAPTLVSTANPVNSCASNPYTSQTVCTANNNSVYLLSGTGVTATLPSGASGNGFTNNSCQNCGVVLNHVTNEAVIPMSTSNTSSGLQFLNLMSNAFTPTPPVSAVNPVSEGILWDAGRNLILSPNGEGPGQNGNGIYDLFDTSSLAATPELSNRVYTLPGGGAGQTSLESAAEDCLTGIALAAKELSSALYLADLTQRTTPTSTSWTAPQQFLFFPEFQFNQGNAGIAVAPGSHLALVTGESGGNQFGVVELPPAAPTTGAPGVVDYVAAFLPNTPDTHVWNQGSDPHTLTAYVDPNDTKAYAVMANSSPPKFLAVIDMAALLEAPRLPTEGPQHTVDQAGIEGCSQCVDLLGTGIVRYVATGN
jgi:hypothetical protein